MLKTTIFILVLIFLTSFVEVSYPWESDMHYGLTKWLAVKAGFSKKDAEIIAAGAESADESNVLKASVVVPIYVCIGRSEEASRHIQQHHFPSDGFVRSSRRDRITIPGDPFESNGKPSKLNGGNLWVRQVIGAEGISEYRNTNLNRLGQSLHPLADSWAHQGKPGKPPLICTDDLVWSHSKERGGWGSHDADITHKHVGETIASARAIYHYMGKFLENYPDEYRVKKFIPWNDEIKGKVEEFAELKTATGKKTWFDNNGVPVKDYTTYPCFLRTTSLKEHQKICSREDDAKKREAKLIGKLEVEGPEVYKEVSNFFDFFLKKWIVERTFDTELVGLINIPDVKKRLIEGQPPEWRGVDQYLWIRTLLFMWLIDDHGLVNESGHGLPQEGFNKLAHNYTVNNLSLERKTLSDLIYFPDSNQLYEMFLLTKDKYELNYELNVACVFSFVHAPRDTLIFISSKTNGGWQITGMSWMID